MPYLNRNPPERGARGSPPRQRGLNVLGLWRLAGAFTIPIGDLFLDVEGRPIP